jgi:microsomal dipeptidase-like Zn-dependent dipeptidase
MTALAKAESKVVIVSLYPFEKHFLSKRIWGFKGLTDVLVNLAASISQSRIDYVLNHTNYFDDLEDEYNYYKELHNEVQQVNGKIFTYKLVSNLAEIEANQTLETPDRKVINIILTIEGGHSFNAGLDRDNDTSDSEEVLANVKKVKSWKHRPMFITLAHHFYNELCGHARSISISALKENQNRGMNTGITKLGMQVLESLLNNDNKDRIPIDVKHMSTSSRKTYYELLDSNYAGERIPIIVSHGACNGFRSLVEFNETNFPEHLEWFSDIDINIYDDEIIRIARSNGLFGLQMDERRIGSEKAVNESKVFFTNKKRQLRKKSLLVWRQIEHMAEVLDKVGLFCWGIQSIGSDFDGIVNPLKGIWTSEDIKDLALALVPHADEYLKENSHKLKSFNQIDSKEIIERLLQLNAMEFIDRNYN